jgi:predicted nucleotidyltransferase
MTDYQSLLRTFQDEKLQYLIVGGVAVNLHGYPRFTNDIDILLALDKENLEKMADIMGKLGYQQRLPVSIQELGDEVKVCDFIEKKGLIAYSFIHAQEPQFNIDVLVAASMEFEKFSAHKMHATVWGIEVPVVSINDLIAMKKNSDREKDVQDVVALLELKGV